MRDIFAKIFKKGKLQKIDLRVEIIEFQDKEIFYAYTPSLNIMGYGKNAQEARKSWEVVFEEYIRYTANKKTLIKDLESYGWTISKKHIDPPSFDWLIQNNQQARDVFNKHDFNKTSKPIKVPLAELYA